MIVFLHLFSTYSKRLGMFCDQQEEEEAPAAAAAAEGISVDAEWTQLQLLCFFKPDCLWLVYYNHSSPKIKVIFLNATDRQVRIQLPSKFHYQRFQTTSADIS